MSRSLRNQEIHKYNCHKEESSSIRAERIVVTSENDGDVPGTPDCSCNEAPLPEAHFDFSKPLESQVNKRLKSEDLLDLGSK